jgi:hypothetical protein
MTQPLYTVRQVAYVVRDMEKALKYWTEYLKVGPFFMLEHAPLENQKYRGGASDADISIALGNSGDVQIELIYCENDAPSVYKEFLDAGKTGVHEAAFECTVGGAPLVYFDTVDSVGHFIELWDNNEVYLDLFKLVEDAAKGWDGSDPVRPSPL